MSSRSYDAIIIGAGPAGATAANLLSRQGLTVLMLDRGQHPTPQIPQTYCGWSDDLLQRLGVDGNVKTALEPPKPVRFVACQGDFDFSVEIQPCRHLRDERGLTLNRTVFDRLLVEEAVRQGVTYLPRTLVTEIIQSDKRVTGVICENAGNTWDYLADSIVDASGKFSLLPNILTLKTVGEPLDERIAVFSHFVHPDFAALLPDGGMTVVTLEGGYLLIAPLSDDRFSVIAVLARSAPIAEGKNPSECFHRAIAVWLPLAEAVAKAQRTLPVIPVIDRPWQCRSLSGPGYLITGEAAVFGDPFFSTGVAFALDSGELAARAIQEIAAGRDRNEVAITYDQLVRESIDRHQDTGRVWLDSLPLRQLTMACADPHLPWGVPLAVLHLFGGADPLDRPTLAMTRARQQYASVIG
ncbi:MAG: NAD(P)/FAD-dependent oxidoreductase [Microcystis sp. M015S2]|uniref:NAD(P)/FAD-dependent oxidoreductase n=1 Tax=unclassified Microcystis TaxID=2643300 RepID=UPI002584E2BA|nr:MULTISPECIES: NAD(P)/FAD-dependent oxidoreductase [unclassified Microcystis]MCA2711296.1 NAD(P)/FAD-dependent oxidoreductase [Microcystis sp. M025S2]MCA2743593.1 NAD(P)/FAD-dependent oxidoreductase [Microcystis sp. M015S2]MCA2757714.1 NAD(P)/FAD-dependent oxidoreductase [Microcystis sp. M145S2]